MPNYQPDDVFDAGIIASNLPSARGLSISSHDEILAPGSIVDVGLQVARFRLGSTAMVTAFERGEMLRLDTIKGDATASLEFALYQDQEHPGTHVKYVIEVAGRGRFARLAQSAISMFVESNTEPLVRAYRNKIISHLDRHTGTSGPRQAS